MCFSNLPVEFDADGTPRLVDADEEERADATMDADRATSPDGLDPEARYRAILDELPARVRDQFTDDAVDHRESQQRAD